MEHPVRDIRNVVKSLCQGTPQEQRDTVNRYFLPSASFIHPFCRVPSFDSFNVPVLGEINSRMLVLAIFKWYKILSPKIDLDIESVVFDQRTCQLYMTISQVFSIWFIPFYKAPVRLITVLQLVPSHQQQNATTTNGGGNTNGSSTNGNQTPIHHLNGTDEDEPSYAEVLAGSPASPSSSARGGNSSSTHTNGSRSSGPNRYMIKSQDDHYQVNEFLKFILGVPGAYLWYIWQLLSTAACIVGVIIFTPIMGILAPYIAKRVRGRNNSAATPSRQKMS